MKKLILVLIFVSASSAWAQSFKPNPLDPSYNHDFWGTSKTGIINHFQAYTSNFDDEDDDNKDGSPDMWGVPEWVAYQMKSFESSCISTAKRPNKWITDKNLYDNGIMPNDSSYSYSSAFRKIQKDWFDRGHLIMKLQAERLGPDAAWNTHTFFNAVPQRHSFNAGIWLDLEYLTAAWAQHYGSVWVVTGPIFFNRTPISYIGESGEFPVAVPDALFKIVIKHGMHGINQPDVLAFIYPQISAGYSQKEFDHTRYLTSVNEIEELTGLDFLMNIPAQNQDETESVIPRTLWDVHDQDFINACNSQYND